MDTTQNSRRSHRAPHPPRPQGRPRLVRQDPRPRPRSRADDASASPPRISPVAAHPPARSPAARRPTRSPTCSPQSAARSGSAATSTVSSRSPTSPPATCTYVAHVRGRERRPSATTAARSRTTSTPGGVSSRSTRSPPIDVEALRDDLKAAGLSPRTVVRHLTVAHGVFKHAIRKHGLARNPASAELVDRPTVSYSGEFKTLDPEQLAALIRHAEHRAGRRPVPHRRADRDAPGRTARAAVDRRRLRRQPDPRPPLRDRRLQRRGASRPSPGASDQCR